MRTTTFIGSALAAVLSLGAPAGAHEVLPGVVTDPALDTVYLMRAKGGIEAVRIRDGATTWATGEADVPLASDGVRLLAQRDAQTAGHLDLTLFENGAARNFSVPLPDGITARVNETMRGRFTVSATIEGAQAFVRWENVAYTSRADILARGAKAAPRTTEGAARIDLGSATATAIKPSQVPDPLAFAPAAARAAFGRGELAGPPVRAGNLVVASRHVPVEGRSMPELSLLRWDASGAALPALTVSNDRYVFHRFGVDGTLLVCEQDPTSDARYIWRFLDAATGKEKGTVRSTISTPRYVLSAGVVVHETPATSSDDVHFSRELQAVSLSGNQAVWSRPFRVTQYNGPQAP